MTLRAIFQCCAGMYSTKAICKLPGCLAAWLPGCLAAWLPVVHSGVGGACLSHLPQTLGEKESKIWLSPGSMVENLAMSRVTRRSLVGN